MAHIIIPKQPTGFCEICEVPFFSTRDAIAHLQTPEHENAVEAAVFAEARRRSAVSFLYDDPDPEVTKHYKDLGERMLREKRWDVKKHERAGGAQ